MSTKTNPLDNLNLPEIGFNPQAVLAKSNADLARADREKTLENQADLKKEPRIQLSLSPMYRDYFGDIMTVSLNGLSIYFPVDGRSHGVPASFAAIIQGRRRGADDQIMRQNRLADVHKNQEDYAGGLELVPR